MCGVAGGLARSCWAAHQYASPCCWMQPSKTFVTCSPRTWSVKRADPVLYTVGNALFVDLAVEELTDAAVHTHRSHSHTRTYGDDSTNSYSSWFCSFTWFSRHQQSICFSLVTLHGPYGPNNRPSVGLMPFLFLKLSRSAQHPNIGSVLKIGCQNWHLSNTIWNNVYLSS